MGQNYSNFNQKILKPSKARERSDQVKEIRTNARWRRPNFNRRDRSLGSVATEFSKHVQSSVINIKQTSKATDLNRYERMLWSEATK
jgi:hypothetical protein